MKRTPKEYTGLRIDRQTHERLAVLADEAGGISLLAMMKVLVDQAWAKTEAKIRKECDGSK